MHFLLLTACQILCKCLESRRARDPPFPELESKPETEKSEREREREREESVK